MNLKVSVNMSDFGKLNALVAKVRPSGRAQLNRVAVNAVTAKVQRHIHSYAMGKHFSATSVGGKRTGHYEKGAAAISNMSNADGAEVIIPIPGIGRAYHDIVLTTPTRNARRYLTIAKHAKSYGKTVEELRTQGWKIFRPGDKKILLGYRNKGEKPVILFTLAEHVKQKRDPRLLPTQGELAVTFAASQAAEINRVMRKAGK